MRKPLAFTAAFALIACGTFFLATPADAQGVLFVKDNKVGIGISTPVVPLHVVDSTGSGGTTMARLENNGPPKLIYKDTLTGGQWEFSMQGSPARFVVNQIGTAGNEFSIRPNGTVIFDGNGTQQLKSENDGDLIIKGNLTELSSRAEKQDFETIDGREMLEKVVALPLSEWSYKVGSAERHVGPMAEDFWEAFGLGVGSDHIAVSDKAGVALAAIQGLYDLVSERDQEIAALQHELQTLKERIGN